MIAIVERAEDPGWNTVVGASVNAIHVPASTSTTLPEGRDHRTNHRPRRRRTRPPLRNHHVNLSIPHSPSSLRPPIPAWRPKALRTLAGLEPTTSAATTQNSFTEYLEAWPDVPRTRGAVGSHGSLDPMHDRNAQTSRLGRVGAFGPKCVQ